MSTGTTKAPDIPIAPTEYDQRWMDNVLKVLSLYFATIDNAGPSVVATQRNGTNIKAGLSFSQPDPTNKSLRVLSIPSQADIANIRTGDVYYDSTAGNVLKIKT